MLLFNCGTIFNGRQIFLDVNEPGPSHRKQEELLKTNMIGCSMSLRYDWRENVAMESFFFTYKLENDLDDNSKILLAP